MSVQWADAVRDARNDAIESNIGTAPILRIYNGTMPATPATALSGNTLLAEGTLPADWLAASSAGVKSKLGTWTLTGQAGAGAGTNATFYRIYKSDGVTCVEQGKVFGSVVLATSGSTAANGNVLNFASTTGVSVGMKVSGTGVPSDTFVLAVTATTVTISRTSTAGVGSAVNITFNGDMTLDNTNIASGQSITVNSYSITDGNA